MDNAQLYNKAKQLAYAGIIAAMLEALFSVYLGVQDETLTLFGFGIGSVLEVVSGIGILLLINRQQHNINELHKAETLALRITGFSFYALAVGLLIGAISVVYTHHLPDNKPSGIIIALFSMVAMYIISTQKINVGNKLHSHAIIADGKCGMVCIYMSVVLLIASVIYYFTRFAYADALGSIALAVLCYNEGKECIEKLHGGECKH